MGSPDPGPGTPTVSGGDVGADAALVAARQPPTMLRQPAPPARNATQASLIRSA